MDFEALRDVGLTFELCSETEMLIDALLCQQEMPQVQRKPSDPTEFAISFLVCVRACVRVCVYSTRCGLPKYFLLGTSNAVPSHLTYVRRECDHVPGNPIQ